MSEENAAVRRSSAQAPRGMHWCPGGCEACVPNSSIACHLCWPKVPLELRKTWWQMRDVDAARAVIAWLVEDHAEREARSKRSSKK